MNNLKKFIFGVIDIQQVLKIKEKGKVCDCLRNFYCVGQRNTLDVRIKVIIVYFLIFESILTLADINIYVSSPPIPSIQKKNYRQ